MESEVDFSYMYETFSNLIDKDQKCVFYLSSKMVVIDMSEKAKQMVSSVGCLKVVEKKLVSSDTSGLRSCFMNSIQNNSASVVFVRNAEDDKPCRVNIEPITPTFRSGAYRHVAAMVIVACTGQYKELLTREFQVFFDLTHAEINLVNALHQQMTLSDYADLKGIKVSTVRWTLANVFSKTQSNSQNQLRELANIFTK